ncbi:MAG: hypothetical protein ACOCQR_03615 [bacterium]
MRGGEYIRTFLVFLIVFSFFSFACYSATTAQHIMTSKALSNTVDSNFEAFLLGFGSHAVLDSLNYHQYVFNVFEPDDYSWELVGLETFVSLYEIYQSRNNSKELWGIVGALTPDIIDGVLTLTDSERWFEGDLLLPFHRSSNNQKLLNKEETMAITVVLFSFSKSF